MVGRAAGVCDFNGNAAAAANETKCLRVGMPNI
jgi:hypothetical protein